MTSPMTPWQIENADALTDDDYAESYCPECDGTGDDPRVTWGDGDLPCPDYMKDVHPACERCRGTGEYFDPPHDCDCEFYGISDPECGAHGVPGQPGIWRKPND